MSSTFIIFLIRNPILGERPSSFLWKSATPRSSDNFLPCDKMYKAGQCHTEILLSTLCCCYTCRLALMMEACSGVLPQSTFILLLIFTFLSQSSSNKCNKYNKNMHLMPCSFPKLKFMTSETQTRNSF